MRAGTVFGDVFGWCMAGMSSGEFRAVVRRIVVDCCVVVELESCVRTDVGFGRGSAECALDCEGCGVVDVHDNFMEEVAAARRDVVERC